MTTNTTISGKHWGKVKQLPDLTWFSITYNCPIPDGPNMRASALPPPSQTRTAPRAWKGQGHLPNCPRAAASRQRLIDRGMLDHWKAQYAPQGGGYVVFNEIQKGVLERLPRFDPWRELPRELETLKAKAAAWSAEFGFRRPSRIVGVLFAGDPLLAGVSVFPMPTKHEGAKAWTSGLVPAVHYITLRGPDGDRRPYDDLFETVAHEFLHRCELEHPEAFEEVIAHYAHRDVDGGYCTSAIKQLAPVLANLSLSTPQHERDTLEQLRQACRRAAE